MGSFALGEVPIGTLHSGGGKRIPGEFRIGESYRSFSGIFRTGIQKKNLPGLDPSIAQWLATLFHHLSITKEIMIASFMKKSYTTNHRYLNELRRLLIFSVGVHESIAVL